MSKLSIILAICGSLCLAESGDDFCDGLNQSPVIIETRRAVNNPTLGRITFLNFNKPTRNRLELLNNGDQIQLRGFNKVVRIRNGALPAPSYILDQLHFHVGAKDDRGSEHSVNRRFFPAEMHLVFYSSDYRNFDEAKNRPQGLAVLAPLFKISKNDNSALQPIIRQLCRISRPDSSIKIDPLALRGLLPWNVNRFYRYRGGLTTDPPCFESVVWTVFKEFSKISRKQLTIYRKCLSRILDNIRPIQKLNGRLIEQTP
ncbi:carbonic anhydrase 9-like [Liolophura sinensis]|uniref:carbonic anhydrase 9-like n=1 Tax=Liolophura sinensis TaxID=3198878 RepID=UPI0031583429